MRNELLRKKDYRLRDIPLVCLRAAPWASLAVFLLTLVSGLLPMVTALVTANFIDTALVIRRGEEAVSAIRTPILLVVITVAAGWMSEQGAEYASRIVQLNLRKTLRPEALEKQAKLCYRHIENPDTWDLISRVTKKIEGEFAEGFCGWSGYASAINLGLSVVSVISLLAAHVWWAAAITVAFSVPLVMLANRGGKANYQAQRDTEREERLQEYYINTLLSREVAEERALFSFTKAWDKKFANAFLSAYKTRFRVQAKWFARMKLSSILYGMIAVLISLTLLFSAVRGELSEGLFMSLSIAAFSLVQSMSWQLTGIADSFAKRGEYMKDLSKFMALEEDEGALSACDAPPVAFESLEFKHVSFAYPGTNHWVLDDFNICVRAGEHVSFVGVNGAGKTTATKLMTGLYRDYKGEILLNGKDIREMDAAQLRAMFALVFQDFARYPVSVKDNAAFGMPDREKALPEAARKCGLEDAVKTMKEGYDTKLGRLEENGQELSGGQWQRLAIARALVNPAPIRILDEPTAALDPIAEAEIYQNFHSFSEGFTTLFISHRLGSTKLSDRVYVLGEGRVLECGAHEQLLQKGGLYAEMFEAQRSWYQ